MHVKMLIFPGFFFLLYKLEAIIPLMNYSTYCIIRRAASHLTCVIKLYLTVNDILITTCATYAVHHCKVQLQYDTKMTGTIQVRLLCDFGTIPCEEGSANRPKGRMKIELDPASAVLEWSWRKTN
jgi:hypothetical protein